jgi:hypothetical protein
VSISATSGPSGEGEAAGPPAWESPGEAGVLDAFSVTLRELVLHPARFFGGMSLTGGLREPLAMFWLLLAVGVLLSFPLALAHFSLTAPDPQTAQYSAHLLLPRAAGFLTLMLPLVLFAAGLVLVVQGTMFHATARFFGAPNWEGSVSVWCYARSAALVPMVTGEALAMLTSLACCVLVLAWPELRSTAGQVSRWSLLVLAGLGCVCSEAVFAAAILAGCVQAFQLPGERGAAAALAGVLLVLLVTVALGWVFFATGFLVGLSAAGATSALVLICVGVSRFVAVRSEDRAAESGPAQG